MFKVGDHVVYPHHGAGEVLEVMDRDLAGESKVYLKIRIIHNDMTVMVPSDAAEQAGIRAVVPEALVEEVEAVLRGDPSQMPQNWNRRYKHNRDKIKTGDIFEVAEVVRNLALRDSDKGLSTGEKQMFGRVKKILASELMYAKAVPEADAMQFLEVILEQICEDADFSAEEEE